MSHSILVIHGPNLNSLGTRETDIYGSQNLDNINSAIKKQAETDGVQVTFFQSNHEGELVDAIHESSCDGILINPAAFTHTSVAIRDAIASCQKPAIEIHLSNIYARESFRHHSYVSAVCIGQVAGFGPTSYLLGLQGMIAHLNG